MCGLPPYTADRLIDVVGDRRRRRRSGSPSTSSDRCASRPAEGLALLAAGRALLAVPGSDADGPLATALDKLEDALGAPGGSRSTSARGDHLERLQRRGRRRRARRDRLLLVRARRDDHPRRRPVAGVPRVRRVVPRRVVPPRARASGCSASTASARCAPTGEHFDPPPRADDDARDLVYRPRPDDPRVTLRLAPGGRVGGREPSRTSRPTSARTAAWQVVLAVSEPAWLERLLLALGPDATVVGAARARRASARTAAARLAAPLRRDVSADRPRVRFRRRRLCEDGAVEHPR